MSTINFKDFLKENISTGSLDKAIFLIGKYLKKKTGKKFFKLPGIEQYSGGNGSGHGIRMFSSKDNLSVRFNWKTSSPTATSLSSIDIWFNSKKPFHIKFDRNTSLVKTIPLVADAINSGGIKAKEIYSLPDGVPLNESTEASKDSLLTEATASAGDIGAMFDDIVEMITGTGFRKGKVKTKYRSAGLKIFDAITEEFPSIMEIKGISYTFVGKKADITKLKDSKDNILTSIGCSKATVSRSGGSEKIVDTSNGDALMADRERITFEEQLKDLENLLKLTVNGAANAIFVAGRGGVGKTHTTEKILGELGMRDGKGYFKNTGSTTAAVCTPCFSVIKTISFFSMTVTMPLRIKKAGTFSRRQLIQKRSASLFGTRWAKTSLILKRTSPTKKCSIRTLFPAISSSLVRSSLSPT